MLLHAAADFGLCCIMSEKSQRVWDPGTPICLGRRPPIWGLAWSVGSRPARLDWPKTNNARFSTSFSKPRSVATDQCIRRVCFLLSDAIHGRIKSKLAQSSVASSKVRLPRLFHLRLNNLFGSNVTRCKAVPETSQGSGETQSSINQATFRSEAQSGPEL